MYEKDIYIGQRYGVEKNKGSTYNSVLLKTMLKVLYRINYQFIVNYFDNVQADKTNIFSQKMKKKINTYTYIVYAKCTELDMQDTKKC